MGGWVLYLTKVSVFLILFYLFFKVFLSRDTFSGSTVLFY